MKNYKCHKAVEAFKITAVSRSPGTVGVILEGEDDNFSVPPSYVEKHLPGLTLDGFLDGYYVRHDDGHESWWPGEAFEMWHTEISAEGQEEGKLATPVAVKPEGKATHVGLAEPVPGDEPSDHGIDFWMKKGESSEPGEIITHKGNPLNNALRIATSGGKGPGGAHNRYRIDLRDGREKPETWLFNFQNGNPADGMNGITNEALLAIVRHRLAGFQSGPYACEETEQALGHVVEAMAALSARTQDRLMRGVEGEQKE